MVRQVRNLLSVGMFASVLLLGSMGTSWGDTDFSWGVTETWLLYLGPNVLDGNASVVPIGHIKSKVPLSVGNIFEMLKECIDEEDIWKGCPKTKKGPPWGFSPGFPTITEKHNTFVFFVFDEKKVGGGLACHKKVSDSTAVDARIVPATVQTKFMEKDLTPKLLFFFCDLGTLGDGGKNITFTIATPDTWNDGTGQFSIKPPVYLQGRVNVHALYRFRITSGPVFSDLIYKNKNFTTVTNSAGQMVISSDTQNESPVNYPLFLKFYLHPDGRDILEDPSWWGLSRISMVTGINLFDKPLDNFYVGLGYEPVLGVDIVGGAHMAKLKVLTGGFEEGQVVTSNVVATRTIIRTGYFAGVMVDIGVIGTWLGNSIASTLRGMTGLH